MVKRAKPYFVHPGIISSFMLGYVVFLRAYIEPGFTSYFLKILISILVGGALAFRYLWSRIKPYFHRLKAGRRAEAEDSEDKEP